ncbi:MAG: hypothetical protein ACYTKD_23190 [Planctomycetota bacterium]|jgi:hypothetical protein
MAGKKKQAKGAKPKAVKGAVRKAAKSTAQGSPGKAADAAPAGAKANGAATSQEKPKEKAKPNGKEKAKAKEKAKTDLTPLRKKAEEAKAAFDKARKEAAALRAKAKETEAAAKKAYAEAVGPYRDACRKAGARCDLPAIKAPSTLPRARFLIKRVKGGLKVAVKDRPKTEETIPDKILNDSVWQAAREYCVRHFDEWTGGRARGLGLRFQAALATE